MAADTGLGARDTATEDRVTAPPPDRFARLRRARWPLVRPTEPAADGPGTGRARLLYAAVLVLYPLYHLALNSRVVLTGQMWAELADYYGVTRSLPLAQQLWATDASYHPLPQRVLATAASVVGLPPAVFPYYFTAVALLGAAALAGTLCLPAARTLIASDVLRFAIVLAILAVPDFNTKAFTNFTYFAVVLCVVVAGLALRDRHELPAWAWAVPVFMLSKPLVLLMLPPLLVGAAIHRSRRAWGVAVASAVVAAVQVHSVAASPSVIATDDTRSLWDTVALTVEFTLGYLGRFTTSVLKVDDGARAAWFGLAVLVAALVVSALTRHPAAALALLGVYLVLVTAVTDVYTLGRYGFDETLSRLTDPIPTALDRWFVGAEMGAILVVGALVAMVVENRPVRRVVDRAPAAGRPLVAVAAVLVFALWFSWAGWSDRARVANAAPGIPLTNISQWQQLSDRIASDDPLLCVPLNQNWIWGRNCTALQGLAIPEPDNVEIVGYRTERVTESGRTAEVELPVPPQVTDNELISLAVLVRPQSGPATVGATATLTLDDGSEVRLTAQQQLSADGGLLQFVERPARSYTGVTDVTVSFDEDVQMAITNTLLYPPGILHVMWMGVPPVLTP